MTGDLPWPVVRPEAMEGKFRQWRAIVDRMHETTRFTPNERLWWTPLERPVRESTVALVSTAGVRLRSQTPFDLTNPAGDPTFRIVPGTADLGDIVVEHSHYDTASANADPNVVFPLDRLRELADEGVIGAVSDVHIGMMGWNPDGTRVRDETAPQIAAILREHGVEAAILTPG